MGYCSWGHNESVTTERLTHTPGTQIRVLASPSLPSRGEALGEEDGGKDAKEQ